AELQRLIDEPRFRERLAAGARLAVDRCYDWDVIARRHVELYEQLAS
ncbi:MAG: hypothetical protein QOD83_1918, partial [Solirubrobacteraceae bacterium]|nr:hypothetical protein [Solirubrobacteraceae bacterium]